MSTKRLTRRVHKVIGIILILPMLGWLLTGMVFFIKPGYEAAYHQLQVKTYPLEDSLDIEPDLEWQEVRLIKTILGRHLLVSGSGVYRHLNAETGEEWALPGAQAVHKLVEDALSVDASRYGSIQSIDGTTVVTETGVEVVLDWKRLSMSQRGSDTQVIDALYRVHYLQWTPWRSVNEVLGFVGLLLLLGLTVPGLLLFFRRQ